MSISFNGLASGLDTSSWVESLTALKRAKITSLQKEKEAITLSKDTLSSIKSFFNSFRNVIQKVTDIKFNVGTMDVFAQNIANSSNLKILTATATPDAIKGTYDITVDKLASNTKAFSGYNSIIETEEEITATENTLLSKLGIKAGRFQIGASTVSIASNETIASLSTKLGNIGYTGVLDNKGIYSIDTGIEAIKDIDNTGIIQGLRLSGAAPGYETFSLANRNTKLSALGVSAGMVELSDSSGNQYLLELEDGDTIGDFIDALGQEGFSAHIDKGVLTLENANITNDTTTNLISALGLNEQRLALLSNPMLTYDTVSATYTTATEKTLLNDLATDIKVKNDDTIIYKNNSGTLNTITIQATDTIEVLQMKISREGAANVGFTNGIFTMDNEIVGGTYDIVKALGLSCSCTVSGNQLTETPTIIKDSIISNTTIAYTITTTATGTSKLSDFGIDKTWFTLVKKYPRSETQETLFLENDATFNDLISLLNNHGVLSSISNGVFTVNSDWTYLIKDGAAEQLGMTVETAVTGALITSGTYAKGAQSTTQCKMGTGSIFSGYRTMNTGVLTTPSGAINQFATGTITLRKNGPVGFVDTVTLTIDKTTSYNDLNKEFNKYGLNIECNNGIFRITPTTPNSTSGYYISSSGCNFLEYLNINPADLAYSRVRSQYEFDTTQASGTIQQVNSYSGINSDTTFGMLGLRNTEEFSIAGGNYTTTISSSTKVVDFENWLSAHGFNVSNNDSKVSITKVGPDSIDNTQSNKTVLNALRIKSNYTTKGASRTITEDTRINDIPSVASMISRLSSQGLLIMNLDGSRSLQIYINGNREFIKTDATISELFDIFELNGIHASLSNGKITLSSEQPFEVSGGLIDKLLDLDTRSVSYTSSKLNEVQYTPAKADADDTTKLKELGVTSGEVVLHKGNNNYTLHINATNSIDAFTDQIADYGLTAYFNENNAFCIASTDKENFSLLKRSGGSNILDVLLVNEANNYTSKQMQYKTSSGSVSVSDKPLTETITVEKEGRISAANYVNLGTKLKDLNITAGSFSLLKDGKKKVIQIDEDETFQSLSKKLESYRILANHKNGHIMFCDADGGVLTVGTNTDTSNITTLLGLHSEGNLVIASRASYRVNGNSTLADSGLFRRGDITEGTFTIGNAEFEITNTTTLNELIAQINSSNDSNATAYWDSVNGDLVIKSRTTGAALINIESGTSNFTDILGFTQSGGLTIDYQELGSNASFSINGTDFTSTSNTVTSDITRIAGVTINLNEVSGGEKVTLSIEKDSTTASNAMQDIVNAYNDLVDSVDKEVAKDSNLKDQSTLKLIKNQIRSLMVNSYSNDSMFKNLSAIGITTEAASSGNIRTDNINKLSFNKEKFTDAFKSNPNALKNLLVGDDKNKGIFIRIEDVLESTLKTSGYFDSAEKAYNSKISRLNDKITKQTAYADRYKERLEKKFQTMDLLISKIQQQYSSFLGS